MVLASSASQPGFTLIKSARINTPLPLTFASRQILAGSLRYTCYTVGQFACQFTTARTSGQNCSSRLMGANNSVGPVEVTARWRISSSCRRARSLH
jgi:hypothetical protein